MWSGLEWTNIYIKKLLSSSSQVSVELYEPKIKIQIISSMRRNKKGKSHNFLRILYIYIEREIDRYIDIEWNDGALAKLQRFMETIHLLSSYMTGNTQTRERCPSNDIHGVAFWVPCSNRSSFSFCGEKQVQLVWMDSISFSFLGAFRATLMWGLIDAHQQQHFIHMYTYRS